MKPKHTVSIGLFIALPVLIIAVVLGYRGALVAAWSAVLVAGNALFAAGRARRARQRSRGHRALESGARLAALRVGGCVLEGHVAYADGADRALRVDFEQVYTEQESSGSWSHTWIETRRKLTVHPFYLIRADGTRLRVEPTEEQSQLFDELESKILVPEWSNVRGPTTRTRFATLVPGERVWVTGRLERGFDPEQAGVAAASGYREAAPPASWLVRGEPLIVSSVSLAAHFAARARQHLRHAIVLLVFLLVSATMPILYVDRVLGTTVVVPVESVVSETDDADQVTGYRARASYHGSRLEGESLYAPPALGSPMEFRVGWLSDNPGPRARFTGVEMVLCFGIAAAALVLECVLRSLSARALPWYRSERVKVTENGNGRLTSA